MNDEESISNMQTLFHVANERLGECTHLKIIAVLGFITFCFLACYLAVKMSRDRERQRSLDEGHAIYTLFSASSYSKQEFNCDAKLTTINESDRSYITDSDRMISQRLHYDEN